MAEVEGTFIQSGDVTFQVYYEDTNGQPTRVVVVNPGTRVNVTWEISTPDGKSKTRQADVPTGTNEYQIPTGTARKYDLRTDAEGNAVTPEKCPSVAVWTSVA